MKKRLSQTRYASAYDDKDKGGSSRKGIIDWAKVMDDKPKFFDPREGVNKINVIPYEVTSKLHPLVKSNKMKIGELDFMLDIWVHRFAGPDKSVDIVCPKKNYGKPCPICDQVSELYDKGNKDEAKSIQASRRVYLNVQPILHGEAQGLQIWEVSHYLFMKELIEEAHACKSGEDIIPFADMESGKIVKFRMEWEMLGKNKVPKFKSFDFQDREEELDEKLLDQVAQFDKGLILMTAEEIEKVLYGQDDADEDKPSPSSEPEKTEDPPSKKPDPVEKDPEPKPAPAPSEPSASKTKCPKGHKWGEADKHPKDCKECKLWDDCVEA